MDEKQKKKGFNFLNSFFKNLIPKKKERSIIDIDIKGEREKQKPEVFKETSYFSQSETEKQKPEPFIETSKIEKYLFNWDEIPGNDSARLVEFLEQNYGIDWVKKAKIEKINDDKTILVSSENNFISLRLNNEKTKAILKTGRGGIDTFSRIDTFTVNMENGKLNVYDIKKEVSQSESEKQKLEPFKEASKVIDIKKEVSQSESKKPKLEPFKETSRIDIEKEISKSENEKPKLEPFKDKEPPKKLIEKMDSQLKSLEQKAELVTILGLGGCGTNLSEILCNDGKNIGINYGLAVDLERTTAPKIKSQNYVWKLLYTGRDFNPAGGVFISSEADMDNFLESKEELSLETDPIFLTKEYFLKFLEKKFVVTENVALAIFSAAGGTGHGFFRSITKRYKQQRSVPFIPIVILPVNESDDNHLNALATYNYLTENIEKFGLVVLIENKKFKSKKEGYPNEVLFNANISIAECIRTIANAMWLSLEANKLYRIPQPTNINRIINNLSRVSKISTFGYGSFMYYGDGAYSTREAIRESLNNLFCGPTLSPLKKYHISVFIILPYRSNAAGLKEVVRNYLLKRYRNSVNEIVVAQSYTYNVNVALWISGDFKPEKPEFMSFNSDNKKIVEARLKLFKEELQKHKLDQDGTLLKNAEIDFYAGIEKIKV